jgi:predicted dehydrogenase
VDTPAPLRVAVVGARRVRQGTGEFVARDLHRSGADVVAIVGTSPATLDEARRGLAERYGLEARGHLSLAACLEAERIDAVAICSPPEAHRQDLLLAAEARLHVLAEKPLLWSEGAERDPDARPRLEAEVTALCERLASAGRTLQLNAQWPFTLEGFYALHPGLRGVVPSTFSMAQGPTREPGPAMIVDSGSHPISMLLALCGPGTMQDIRVTTLDRARGRLEVAFDWAHTAGRCATTIELTCCPRPPRPASYALDGRGVDRLIDPVSYAFTFAEIGGSGMVAIPDPLTASVTNFLRAARAGTPPDRARLVLGQTQLQALAAAVARGAA